MPRSLKITLGIFLLAFIAGGSFVAGVLAYKGIHQYDSLPDPSFKKISEVRNIIGQRYVKKPSEEKLMNGAVNGMIQALGDPYSNYLNQKHYGRFQEESSGHFDGVGMTIGLNKQGVIHVEAPIEGTPAAKAGIKPREEIHNINGKSTKGMTVQKAVGLIRGKKGTPVILTLYNLKSRKKSVKKLIRAEITLPNVSGKIVNKKYGYMYLHSFNAKSTEDLQDKGNALIKKGAKGLILDLRNNPGGLLDQAIKVTSLFQSSGEVVYTMDRKKDKKIWRVTGNSPFPKIPMIILVNEGSASASEIVTGALQDTKRALIVGEKTFGKGSVQEVATLDDGSAITITTALFYTPKGREIAHKGLRPDIKVKDDRKHGDKKSADKILDRAVQELEKLSSK